MYAIEIKNLTKSFNKMYALNDLSMHVPVGAIYGFIGENGSGKSTTEKLICGHLVKDSGTIELFGKKHSDPGVRQTIGALIENAGCFPNSSIYSNLVMQALNLNISNVDEEIDRVLNVVKMSEHKKLKFKKCSLGMKQRVGIAMALLGNPKLLILDEPINGLDAEGMKLMREILVDIKNKCKATILISSHVLSELEKIATHYGVIREGKMILEISADELENRNRVYIRVKTTNQDEAYDLLHKYFNKVEIKDDSILVYDVYESEKVVKCLLDNNISFYEIENVKIGLEEYYIELMKQGGKEDAR